MAFCVEQLATLGTWLGDRPIAGLYSVAVVGTDNTIEFRNVKVGPRVEGLWVIESGLESHERVVVGGLQWSAIGGLLALLLGRSARRGLQAPK